MRFFEAGLEVVGITKSYGSRVLLDQTSFSVAPGETVCLTGDNGAGKSTLLRCLVGLARFRGVATIGGESLGGNGAPMNRVGYLPQAPALLETATVEETILMFASLRGVDPQEVCVPDGFLPPLDARIDTLSGGQSQRVAITIAFLGQPKLLLLDEPTANLDDHGRILAKEMMRAAAERGASTIVVSPAAVDLASIVDRILSLDGGRVVERSRTVDPIHIHPKRRSIDPNDVEIVEASS